MRYHAYGEAPSYLRAEAGAQRRHERQKSDHPDCRDPDHPGCKHCEPEMFPEPVPKGYMTGDEWAAAEIKLIQRFAREQDEKFRDCPAGWTERFHGFVNEISRGMK